MLSREGFEDMFRELVKEFRQRREKEAGEEAAERNISIDGKTICGAGWCWDKRELKKRRVMK